MDQPAHENLGRCEAGCDGEKALSSQGASGPGQARAVVRSALESRSRTMSGVTVDKPYIQSIEVVSQILADDRTIPCHMVRLRSLSGLTEADHQIERNARAPEVGLSGLTVLNDLGPAVNVTLIAVLWASFSSSVTSAPYRILTEPSKLRYHLCSID